MPFLPRILYVLAGCRVCRVAQVGLFPLPFLSLRVFSMPSFLFLFISSLLFPFWQIVQWHLPTWNFPLPTFGNSASPIILIRVSLTPPCSFWPSQGPGHVPCLLARLQLRRKPSCEHASILPILPICAPPSLRRLGLALPGLSLRPRLG